MITASKGRASAKGHCNWCGIGGRTIVYEYIIRTSLYSSGLSFRLCDECLVEAQNAMLLSIIDSEENNGDIVCGCINGLSRCLKHAGKA